VLNLTNQHKLGVLQRIIIQQRVQFCPLCGAWQYFFFVRPYEEAAWATFYRDITAAPTEPDEAY